MIRSTIAVRAERGSVRKNVCAVLCGIALAVAPVAAVADEEESSAGLATEAGLGVGSAVASLLYAPIKVAYAGAGLIVGGLAWALSGGDADVAKVVLTPSVRGDYVITRRQLTGKEEVEFFGREPEYRPGTTDVAAAPEQWKEGW